MQIFIHPQRIEMFEIQLVVVSNFAENQKKQQSDVVCRQCQKWPPLTLVHAVYFQCIPCTRFPLESCSILSNISRKANSKRVSIYSSMSRLLWIFCDIWQQKPIWFKSILLVCEWNYLLILTLDIWYVYTLILYFHGQNCITL